MKKLFIIRHAKSDWSDIRLDDFDRDLNKRGYKNAPFMGKLLKNKDIKPDLILSSPARRTLLTAEIIAKEIGYEKDILTNQNMYESTSKVLENIVKNIPDENNMVFFIGHNPGLSDLIDILCDIDLDIPTCAVVEIEFDMDSWDKVSKKNAKLISYEYPKKYK